MLPFHTASLLVAVLSHLGGPMLGLAGTAPTDPAPPAPTGGQVGITVDDVAHRVSPGDLVNYVITVRGGATEMPITVRLDLPAALTELRAEGATIIGTGVAWRTTVKPAETRTYTVAGRVDRKAPAADLAVTACVHRGSDTTALSCATDLNEIVEPPALRGLAWIGAAMFGALATVGTLWLQKRIRPELLTPANAHTLFGDAPGQPGGAPSA
jgi:hypothetical protein